MPLHNEWKDAVVHIEGIIDSTRLQDLEQQFENIAEALKRGRTPEEVPSTEERYRGTALFAIWRDNPYLITARHVLRPPAAVDLYRAKSGLSVREGERFEHWIFWTIVRVPSLSDFIEERLDLSGLTALGAGTYRMQPYTYSSEHDLAVISLNPAGHWPHLETFRQSLLQAGHKPVALDDCLADEPTSEGADVYSVGFPNSVAVLTERALPFHERNWRSPGVSLPVTSFGHVAMLNQFLAHFWADMSIYPGNSGGPVIESGKLVGVVSAQARVEGVRVPFAQILKARLLKDLFAEQAVKDERRRSTMPERANEPA